MKWKIVEGDSLELIKKLPDESIDLVITSPPYSDIVNYGKEVSTKKPDDYVDWILPLFNEIWRVLKPTGSFILNINDKCEGGYRSTYIYDLISRNNRETKLKLYDTYIWWKKNGIPNGSNKRFRNTTEFIFHFCKDVKQMKFHMERALREPKESYLDRLKYDTSASNQGIVVDGVRERGKKIKYLTGSTNKTKEGYVVSDEVRTLPDLVRPDNVVRFATAAASRDNTIKHPAPFNKELPLYYINILTDEGDIVLDPFSGIATTDLACKELGRSYVGFELNEKYAEFSRSRLNGIESFRKVIKQYDLDGNFIDQYNYWSEVSKKYNLDTEATRVDGAVLRMSDVITSVGGLKGYKWKIEEA